jgi:hypothetical protein
VISAEIFHAKAHVRALVLSHFAAFSPAKLLHKPMDNMAA